MDRCKQRIKLTYDQCSFNNEKLRLVGLLSFSFALQKIIIIIIMCLSITEANSVIIILNMPNGYCAFTLFL